MVNYDKNETLELLDKLTVTYGALEHTLGRQRTEKSLEKKYGLTVCAIAAKQDPPLTVPPSAFGAKELWLNSTAKAITSKEWRMKLSAVVRLKQTWRVDESLPACLDKVV